MATKKRLTASEKFERALYRKGAPAVEALHRSASKSRTRVSDEDAVRVFFRASMPKQVASQLTAAKWDMNEGPMSVADGRAMGFRGWRGLKHALDVLAAWSDKHLQEVWYDKQSGRVELSEPEGFYDGDEWVEPDYGDYTKFSLSDVRSAVFGDDLAKYVH